MDNYKLGLEVYSYDVQVVLLEFMHGSVHFHSSVGRCVWVGRLGTEAAQ